MVLLLLIKKKCLNLLVTLFPVNMLKKNINGQVVRLALLSTHYKQPLDWNEKLINESQNTLDKWYSQFEKHKVTSIAMLIYFIHFWKI